MQLCQEIRSGGLGRRDAQKKYKLSDNLIHLWLARYDGDRSHVSKSEAQQLAECEAKVSALERKIGELTMRLEARLDKYPE